MEKMKKFLSVLLAMAMVLGMSVTTFAKDITKPQEGDTDKVTITGTSIKKDEVTFKVYQLIEPIFEEGKGFTGYQWSNIYTDKTGPVEYEENGDVRDLTSANITAWAAKADRTIQDATVTWNEAGTEASIELGVGTWMILASAADDVNVVYNPMIASVYYTQQDSMTGGTADADAAWKLTTTNAYEKSTDLGGQESKQVGTLDASGISSLAKASAEVGKNVPYVLKGLIPSYSAEYFNSASSDMSQTRTVTYKLNDSKNAGLEYNNDIKVYVGNTTTPIAETNYDITLYKNADKTETTTNYAEAAAFSVALKSSYIQTLTGASDAQRTVYVTYTAKVTDAAVSQVAENQFDVSYTRTPGQPEETTDTKTVYTYTAAINGAVVKIDEKDEALGNATFTLYETYENNTLSNPFTGTTGSTATTSVKDGNDGSVDFTGLEFGKTYYLTETKAPEGYSINNTVYSVVCNYPAGFDEKGTTKLTEYSVTVTNLSDAADTKTVTVPYGGSATAVTNHLTIKNTKLNGLPSTGGIGTTIFTVGGCAIMIAAAGLYFSLRRRTEK